MIWKGAPLKSRSHSDLSLMYEMRADDLNRIEVIFIGGKKMSDDFDRIG
jgi:hypothetical protein